MKVVKDKNALLITPETEFEEQVLCEMFPNNGNSKYTVFMKCGLSVGDIIGLKVYANGENEDS